jgi:hypothetical protein
MFGLLFATNDTWNSSCGKVNNRWSLRGFMLPLRYRWGLHSPVSPIFKHQPWRRNRDAFPKRR